MAVEVVTEPQELSSIVLSIILRRTVIENLGGEKVVVKRAAPIMGAAHHKVRLAKQAEKGRILLVHAQPTLLPGGKGTLGPQCQSSVEKAGVVADVGLLQQLQVVCIQGGVVLVAQHVLPLATARPIGLLLGPHVGMALLTLHALPQVAAAHTSFVWNSKAVLADLEGGRGAYTLGAAMSRGGRCRCTT